MWVRFPSPAPENKALSPLAILKRLLAGQRPGIPDLARELHLGTRTLPRRLTEQGITFQRLLEEARRELARHYLLHSSVELSETAYLLGYEDANSFFRASTIGKALRPDNGAYSKRTHSRQHERKSAQHDVSQSNLFRFTFR